MNKSRPVILIVCITAGISLLAAVNFIPALKNASGPGRVFEWGAACLLGAIAVGAGLVTGHDYTAPSAAPESWRKHRPAKEILSTVPISDMLRAERQFVLYGSPSDLAVQLAILMYQNKQSEESIRGYLQPLLICRDDSIWQYFPAFLMKRQKQQIVKQRVKLVRDLLSAVERKANHNHTPVNGLDHETEKPDEPALSAVRTIINMYRDGRRREDIVDALNAGIMKHRGTGTSQPIATVNNNHP